MCLIIGFFPPSIVWFRKNLFWFGSHAKVSPILCIDFLTHSTAASWLWNLVIRWETPGLKTVFPKAGDGMEDMTLPPKPPSNDNGQVAKQRAKLAERECAGGSWNILRINTKSLSHENQCNKETKWVWLRRLHLYLRSHHWRFILIINERNHGHSPSAAAPTHLCG